jgi:phenylpropionate dioxygenase-like ring-hydroxylating dioxygenase large terminal subunit
MDRRDFGLKPIELEIFHGFIFIRIHPGPQPAIAEVLAPYAADFEACHAQSQLPVSTGTVNRSTELPINWKSVRDVDNEGYHVPIAHPSLQDLYGRDYRDIYLDGGLHMSIGYFNEGGARRWSVKQYLKATDGGSGLSGYMQNAWIYYALFPNTVFAIYPEGASFYHDIPLSPRRTRLTGRDYRHPHETRRQRLARYLTVRINRDTSKEDQQLSIWSDESMRSSAFDGFHLSDLEWGLRRHHDRLRALVPVMSLYTPPAETEVEALNAKLTCATPAQR